MYVPRGPHTLHVSCIAYQHVSMSRHRSRRLSMFAAHVTARTVVALCWATVSIDLLNLLCVSFYFILLYICFPVSV